MPILPQGIYNKGKEGCSMSEYTPGPWRVKTDGWGDPLEYEKHATVIDLCGQWGVFVGAHTSLNLSEQWIEAESMARLIAAAPDLLEALQRVQSVLMSVPKPDPAVLLAIVNDAIAKAKE